MTMAREDGDTIQIWVRAEDVLGENYSSQVRVNVDSTAPSHNRTNYRKNTNRRIDGIRHYTSSILLRAGDPHSGIGGVYYSLSTQNGQEVRQGNIPVKPKGKTECANCKCTPMGDCFEGEVEAPLNNCIYRGLQAGNYTLNVQVYNQALINASLPQKLNVSLVI